MAPKDTVTGHLGSLKQTPNNTKILLSKSKWEIT